MAEETALKEQGLTAFDLTPEELRARWPKRLAAWFEKQLRNGTKSSWKPSSQGETSGGQPP